MKPRKTLRKLVNNFIGKTSKTKEDEDVIENHNTTKDYDDRRYHGSIDDLSTDINDNKKDYCKGKSKKKSMPRRSMSCNNFKTVTASHHQQTCNDVGEDFKNVQDRRFNASKSDDIRLTANSNSLEDRQPDNLIRVRSNSAIQRTTSQNIDLLEDKTVDGCRKCGLDDVEQCTSSGRSRSSEPQQLRRTSSATVSRKETEERLRACKDTLECLTAQMKEIRLASGYRDPKQRNGSLQKTESQTDLRKLDVKERHSRRLISTNSNIQDTSSNSSGYHSESTNNESSAKKSIASRSEKKVNSTHRRPRVTREDSNSSGYATGSGSGSEDGRHESPNGAEQDNVGSIYIVPNGQYHHPSRQALTLAWKNQHFNHGSQPLYGSQFWYDPNTMYYHDYYAGDETIYQTYGDVYGGYAPSSVFEDDVLSNGWYQIQPVPNSSSDHYISEHETSNGNVQNSYWGYGSSTVNPKYGGLSDLFYDPTARPDVSVMESIANEYGMISRNEEKTNFKTYGSFRYRNGQRTVTVPSNPKRKVVRFSQTVHQRVETEESEMEDSTSIIKDCVDKPNRTSVHSLDHTGLTDSEMIYSQQRQHAGNRYSTTHQQSFMPEPIYEFPSGHIESSCMCNDCILARASSQMPPTQAISFF